MLEITLVYFFLESDNLNQTICGTFPRYTRLQAKRHSFDPANSGQPMKYNLGVFLEMHKIDLPQVLSAL